MSASDQEGAGQERRRRTIWLLACGAASLLLPLAGAVYLRWSETTSVGPTGRADVFERRDGGPSKITPSQAVVPMSAVVSPSPASGLSAPAAGGRVERPAESSLDFVKPAAELKVKIVEAPKAATAAAPSAPEAAAAPAAPKPPAKSKAAAKPAKKSFAMPKLQPTRGFSSMKGPASAAPAADASGGQNQRDLLKNLPPGAENNPELQKYLQSRPQGQ